jgi:predicted DNA-binding protein
MIRTQVYLTDELYNKIRLEATTQKKAKAAILRELLEEGIKRKRKTVNAGRTLLKLARRGEKLNFKAPKDLSQNLAPLLKTKIYH